jgi:hypothetical protein
MKVGDVYKLERDGIKYRLEITEISDSLNGIYGKRVALVMNESGYEYVLEQSLLEEACVLDEESPNRKEN